MGLHQRADGDIRAEGASPVERLRRPAREEDGGVAPDRIPPRRSAIAVVTFDIPGGSFAFVMATGIVSIAAMRLGHDAIGTVLFALNLTAFPLLCVLMLIRVFRHPVAVLGELRSHRAGAGFLTAVAATSIVGDQFVLFASNRHIAAALWLASLILWLGLIYAFFVAMTIKSVKPTLPKGLDGTWLLTVVATEAIAILAALVSDVFSRPEIVVFMSLCLFLLGGALYLILISLIVQRWLFEPMQPEQLTLPYWINMARRRSPHWPERTSCRWPAPIA
jgi:tellurite resistance protein TehA-like permease